LTGAAGVPRRAGIDHSLIGVRDLERARQTWQGLGFTATPRGRHIGWGTANYCLMFEQGYVELLGIVDAAQFTNKLDEFLAEREGLLGLAFASADAEATAAKLKADGLAPDGLKDLKRLLELPDGEALPAFRLVFLPPEDLPDLRGFFCQHVTPEIVRRPDWLNHANGARRLAGLTVASDRPADLAPAYARIFGPDALTVAQDALEIATADAKLAFLTPAALAARYRPIALPEHRRPWMAVQTIAVADLEAAAALLRRNGQDPVAGGGGYLIAPEAATGCLLEFVAA
jgi:catechol 2,3-dioxygenase-like lactoylglutathione lyase family enzyme